MTRTRPFHTAGVLLAGLAMLAGCNGDGDAAPTSPVTEISPETTEQIDTTTSSSSTSTTTSTSTSTTLAPTTTVDEIALTKQAVAAAAVQNRLDVLYAIRNYDAPDALEVLGRTTAAVSPSMDVALRTMESLRSNGWRSRESTVVPSTTTVESDVELFGEPAARAQLTVCTIDSGVVYEPGAAPDGSDIIVNDDITARRNLITMVLEDGAWKIFTGDNLETWEGATTCPAD